MVNFATPVSDVSAFCRATLSNLIPDEFWGAEMNKRIVWQHVDRFIRLSRFENVSLHVIFQGIKVLLAQTSEER